MDKQITYPHQFESVFDVEEKSTVGSVPTFQPTTSPPTEELVYDELDNDIEQQIGQVFELAISSYENEILHANNAPDSKTSPEHARVAAQFLATALDATKERRAMKSDKEKNLAKKEKVVNNNTLITTDYTTLLKMMQDKAMPQK